jgi:hypothetical protein
VGLTVKERSRRADKDSLGKYAEHTAVKCLHRMALGIDTFFGDTKNANKTLDESAGI